MGGCAALPSAAGAATLAPERVCSQSSQWPHHDPLKADAASSH
jgi:hypothetical protein